MRNEFTRDELLVLLEAIQAFGCLLRLPVNDPLHHLEYKIADILAAQKEYKYNGGN